MGEHLSQRAYARHRGVTHRAVQKQVLAGHIHLEADGLIDVERADAEWALQTNPAKAFHVAGPLVTPRSERATPRSEGGRGAAAPARPLGAAAATSPSRVSAPASLEAFSQARTLNETYKARTTRLEFERLSGTLVRADDVRLAAFNAARRARDLLLAVPDRLAAVLAGTSDTVDAHRLLSADIRRFCEELARPMLVKGPDGKLRSL